MDRSGRSFAIISHAAHQRTDLLEVLGHGHLHQSRNFFRIEAHTRGRDGVAQKISVRDAEASLRARATDSLYYQEARRTRSRGIIAQPKLPRPSTRGSSSRRHKPSQQPAFDRKYLKTCCEPRLPTHNSIEWVSKEYQAVFVLLLFVLLVFLLLLLLLLLQRPSSSIRA